MRIGQKIQAVLRQGHPALDPHHAMPKTKCNLLRFYVDRPSGRPCFTFGPGARRDLFPRQNHGPERPYSNASAIGPP